MSFLALKTLHIIALFFLFLASLFKNVWISKKPFQGRHLRQLKIADKVSGAAAGIMVGSGLYMLLGEQSNHLFRLQQPVFWIKMLILVVASLLIIVTKIYFSKTKLNASPDSLEIPKWIVLILRFDLASIVLMALLAVIMVRGGY